MKRVINILLVLLFYFPLFADPHYFMEQKASCFMVNLADTKYIKHNNNTRWAQNYSGDDPNYYGDAHMVSVLGAENTSQESVINIQFTGTEDWYYIIGNGDTRYKRPYGLEFIVRVDAVNGGHQTYSVNRLGRMRGSNGSSLNATVTLPVADGTIYKSTWVDVLLVLDPFVNTTTGLIKNGNNDITDPNNINYGYLIPSNEIYSTSFTMTFSGGSTYVFNLQGYYQPDTPPTPNTNTFLTNLSLVSNATASSFQVTSLKPSNADPSSTVPIADYVFTTNSVSSNANTRRSKVYFFVSSNSNPSTVGDEFVLRLISPYTGNEVTSTNKYNSVTYEIGIKSESSRLKWFDGTDDWHTIVSSNDNLLDVARAATLIERASNLNGEVVRITDEGQLLLKIKGDVDDLTAGRYRGYVYFHVITDF